VQDVVESNDAPMLVYDPGHPDADAAGYVAMPNVNPIAEMVNLMGAARAYEAGTSVLQTVRQMAEQALRIGR
jgi:flagellar basal-body rod protein FlgC